MRNNTPHLKVSILTGSGFSPGDYTLPVLRPDRTVGDAYPPYGTLIFTIQYSKFIKEKIKTISYIPHTKYRVRGWESS